MKLKGIIATLMLVLMAGVNANAQADSTEAPDDCAKYRSLYYQYVKQKMYRDAGTFWGNALEACGSENLDGKFYKNGRVIFSQLLKAEKENEVRSKEITDTIYMIYEERMKLEKDASWTADYASLLVSNKSKDFDKIDGLFAESIHELKDKAKSTHVKQYFKHLILNKFNTAPAEGKEDARTIVIEEYIVLSDYVSTALKRATEAGKEKDVKRQKSAQSFLDKYFLKIAQDCDVLVGVFDKKLASLPQDIEAKKKQVNNYLGLMDQKKCQSSEVYGKYVDTLIQIEPTADAYFFGGSYAAGNDDNAKAIKYYEKAVEMEGDGENKDKYLLNLANAQYKSRSYKSAFRTAKSVGGEFKADALVICANAIAATANGCGDSTFERKANYWLANDYIKKAIAAGKTGISSSKFLGNAPDSNEAFNEGISAGSSFTLSCWGESTTVRF